MQERFNHLYEGMMSDVLRLLQTELPELKRVESCYRITTKYWTKVKAICSETSFANSGEEIEFFRCVRPQFTSQIEFYLILYEAMLMVPKNISTDSVQAATQL